jgi:hypothetical protein
MGLFSFLKAGFRASQGQNEPKLRIAGVMLMPNVSGGRLVGLVEARGEVVLVT